MSRHLLDLPQEILIEILAYLDYEPSCLFRSKGPLSRPSHYSLALTCRRLAALTRQSIYSHLTFSATGTVLADDRRRTIECIRRIRLLLKTFEKCPSRINYVQSLVITAYGFFDGHYSIYKDLINRVSSSTSFKHLCFSDPRYGPDSQLAMYIKDCPEMFSSLQILHVYDYRQGLNAKQFLNLFLNLSLRDVHWTPKIPALLGFDDDPRSDKQMERIITRVETRTTASLEELTFDDIDFANDTFDVILSRSPQLRRIRIPHLGHGLQIESLPSIALSRTLINGRYGTDAPYSPKSLSHLLRFQIHTLESLTMATRRIRVYRHDNTRADLSAFTALQKLHLSSPLLFGSPTSLAEGGCGNDRVWSLLPKSLRNLTVECDGEQGIFWSSTHLYSICERKGFIDPNDIVYQQILKDVFHEGSAEVARTMQWVNEIVARKERSFPNLVSIRTVESHWRTRDKVSYFVGVDIVPFHRHFFHTGQSRVIIEVKPLLPVTWESALAEQLDWAAKSEVAA